MRKDRNSCPNLHDMRMVDDQLLGNSADQVASELFDVNDITAESSGHCLASITVGTNVLKRYLDEEPFEAMCTMICKLAAFEQSSQEYKRAFFC